MARVQTRRTFSVSRAAYNAVKEVAAAEGIPAAAWVERLIRREIPGMEPREVVPLSQVTGDSFDRGETTAIPLTRSEIDAMAAARRAPRPGDPAPNARTCAWGVTCEGPFVLSSYDDKLVPACAEHAEEADGERTDRTWKRRAAK